MDRAADNRGSRDAPEPERTTERLVAILALGVLAFSSLVIPMFDVGAEVTVAGIPLLYAYLFLTWLVLIALTAVVMEFAVEADATEDAGRGREDMQA